MTGYASAARELARGALNVELRSVNHRYLDVQFRMPEELRALESGLRELLVARLTRGKVECRVSFTEQAGASKPLQINSELLQQLLQLNATVQSLAPQAHALGVADILRWPGMFSADTPSIEELRATCLELLHSVLDDFTASRTREGEKLKNMLLERAEKMEQLVADVAPRIPQLVASYRDKLGSRLREALINPEDDRIRQELVLFAAKIDVDEELSRLGAHLSEIRRILATGGAVGKRLDFLMQELNREANTLGSKSVDIGVTQVSMQLKVLIEQMREQIQNIE
jgi:uncharacterized protein (TIGR00255 family)